MTKPCKFISALLFLASLFGSAAQAHTPYLAPASFEPLHQGWVTLDASFAEVFFVPEVVFDDSEFGVLNSAGVWSKPVTVQRLKTRAVVEHQLTDKGTHRFSTGVRHGAVFRMYELNGERKGTRDPKEVLPAGAKLLDHFQSVTLAETYLTLGAPSNTALKPYGKGLEVVAVTHPNDLYAGETFRVRVLFDGKALAGQELQVFAANDGAGDEKPVLTVKTDDEGAADLALTRVGSYLLQTRYRHAAPKGAPAPNYSHTYTLTFAVAEQ